MPGKTRRPQAPKVRRDPRQTPFVMESRRSNASGLTADYRRKPKHVKRGYEE